MWSPGRRICCPRILIRFLYQLAVDSQWKDPGDLSVKIANIERLWDGPCATSGILFDGERLEVIWWLLVEGFGGDLRLEYCRSQHHVYHNRAYRN